MNPAINFMVVRSIGKRRSGASGSGSDTLLHMYIFAIIFLPITLLVCALLYKCTP